MFSEMKLVYYELGTWGKQFMGMPNVPVVICTDGFIYGCFIRGKTEWDAIGAVYKTEPKWNYDADKIEFDITHYMHMDVLDGCKLVIVNITDSDHGKTELVKVKDFYDWSTNDPIPFDIDTMYARYIERIRKMVDDGVKPKNLTTIEDRWLKNIFTSYSIL